MLVVVLSTRSLPLGARLRWPPLDLMFGLGAVCVLLGLSLSPWFLLGAGLLAVWWRGAAEVRALFRVPGVLGPHVALLCFYGGVFVVTFVLPFVIGDASTTGLVLLAFPVAALATSYGAGIVADRVGTRPVAVCGAAVSAAGLALMAVTAGSPWGIAWPLAVVGAGFGLLNGQLQVFLMGNAPREQLGVTAATSNVVRQMGIAAGSATGAALLDLRAGIMVALVLVVVCALAVLRSGVKEKVTA